MKTVANSLAYMTTSFLALSGHNVSLSILGDFSSQLPWSNVQLYLRWTVRNFWNQTRKRAVVHKAKTGQYNCPQGFSLPSIRSHQTGLVF